MINSARYYKPLTGIRAVAAYLVFFHHYARGNSAFINEFHVGVTIFFVLSGFLITTRYFEHNRLDINYLFRYFLNRVARIYPTYLFLTCVAFYFTWRQTAFSPDTVRAFILNITFLRGFSEEYLITGVPQGWSLTVEETFYVVAPVWLYRLKKSSPRYLVTLTAFVLLSIMCGVVLTQIFQGKPYGFFSNYTFLFTRTFFGRATEFAIGAGLAMFIRQRTQSVKVQVAAHRELPLATIIGIFGSVLSILALAWIRLHFALTFGTSHWAGILINNLFMPIFISVMFFGFINEQSWISKILATPVMEVLGKSSYCFYLLHLGFFAEVIVYKHFLRATSFFWFNQFLFFAVLIVMSIILHYLLEEPCNKWIRKLARKPAHKLS